jgi:predicted GNAT family N-acyltransferase
MVKIIYHSDLNLSVAEEIIGIKSLSWEYSFEDHMEWMNKNLLPQDIHFLVYDANGILMSYLNLVAVSVLIKNVKVPVMGIGNVCSRTKGIGSGKKLMNELNNYLLKKNYKGLLFCKDALVNFYEKFEWLKIPTINSDLNVNTMVFNFKYSFTIAKYTDRIF